MATAARVKVPLTDEAKELIRRARPWIDGELPPTGDPNPIYDNLKAELARLRLADELLADSRDLSLNWWQRGSLRREARDLRGGVL